MALISKTIPGFYNGVSQQAAPMRLPTQCEDQVNCYSNLVDGLTKRPNSEHLALMSSSAQAGCMVHGINMSAQDQYIMIITGDSSEPVEVFRQDTGAKCDIRYGLLNEDEARSSNCTATNATNVINATAHGLIDGQQIDLDGKLPTELASDTPYYIVNKTTNTFQVSLTSGGSVVTFTDDGDEITFRLLFTEDKGVLGYFSQLDSLEPNQVFKAITLAETTHILNTNVIPKMSGNTQPGEIAGRVQTISDLPTGAGIPSADTSNVIVGSLSYQTQLAADEAGAWVTFTNLLSTGHMTFKMHWKYLTRIASEGATRLEFQWVATGVGWTAPNIEYAWFFDNTFVEFDKYFRLPIIAGNWDIRVRRVGSPDHVVSTPWYGTYQDCNWEGCNLAAWSTGADIYEITGAADSSSKSYYLQHDGDVWLETLRPGLYNKMSAALMPHILRRTATDEFTFSIAAWGDRTVGDNDTSPLPSFLDEEVDNITFFKDRLGLLSQKNVILSQLKAKNYFNFFPTSSIDVLDDDPIDIAATSGDIVPLRSSMVYDKDLVLFSDEKQFILSSGDKPLTPTSATITPTTNYNICNKCEPTGAGANVYFVSPKIDFVSLREYMILPDSLVTDAADVTAHVPNYIPNGDLIVVKALNAFDCLFVWSTSDPSSIFVYKFYWLGNEKPQSSWSKWDFGDDVLGMTTMSGYLTIVIERENGEICLEKIYMEPEQSGNLDWRVALDRRKTLTGSYNAGTGLTTWTMPYDMLTYTVDGSLADANFIMVDEDTGFSMPDVTITSATTMTRSGDYSGKAYLIGKIFDSYFKPTPWYLRDTRDTVITEGRIQVRTLTLSYRDTAYFTVEITPKNRSTLVHTFGPDRLGESIIDQISLNTGERSFSIMAQVKDTDIKIRNNSYLPMQFSVGSWKGSYHAKAKAI